MAPAKKAQKEPIPTLECLFEVAVASQELEGRGTCSDPPEYCAVCIHELQLILLSMVCW